MGEVRWWLIKLNTIVRRPESIGSNKYWGMIGKHIEKIRNHNNLKFKVNSTMSIPFSSYVKKFIC